MNEISNELMANLEKYLEMMNDCLSDVQYTFHERTLYLDFARKFSTELLAGENTTATHENSPSYIFKLLDAKPSKTLKELKSKYSFFTDDDKLELTKESQRLRTFLIMMQFLNVSTYLYKYIQTTDMDQAMQNRILEKLVIAAAAEYDSLYSSRSKNEFSYYFEKLLTTKDNETIEAYNRDKHRWIYNQLTLKLKSDINEMVTSSHGDKMDTQLYSNIAITYGEHKDENFPLLGDRYFINIGMFDLSRLDFHPLHFVHLDFDPLFNTNFA